MNRVLGIDLGTTYSAMACVNDHGRPEILANREGERTTPSIVLFQGDTPIVGTLALRSAVACPNDVVQFVKRQMGSKDWEFVSEEGASYGPEEISALILKRLREDAEAATGHTFDRAVVTVPAYFSEGQRKATHDAGRIAGLEVLRVLNEPTAAALAFGIDSSASGTVLVYDLGGGTFDVTIMRVSAGELQVLATGGDRNLGGFDWDNALMRAVDERYVAEGGQSVLADPASGAAQALREGCETAKRTLSQAPKATVVVANEGFTKMMTIEREAFDEMTRHLVDRTEMLVEMTLDEAELGWGDIDRLLLVGGSTRMPMVHERVASLSGLTPERGVHPDEIVALGAALVADLLDDESGRVPNHEIKDIASHGLGTLALNPITRREENSVIFPKGTKIPNRRSMLFQTVMDGQKQIEVEITEGDEVDPDYVRRLGASTIPIPAYDAGAPIEIFLDLDENGIIGVSVIDLVANAPLGTFTIDRQANMSDTELEAAQTRMSDLEVS